MASATHIIGKQSIHVRYFGEVDAFALRQQVASICKDELPARLNSLLDEYDQTDYVFRIEKLNVAVSLTNGSDLQNTLGKAIIEKIEQSLRKLLEGNVQQSISVGNSFLNNLLYYFEKGYLPWDCSFKDIESLKKNLEALWDEAFIQNISKRILALNLQKDEEIRFIRLLNPTQFSSLIAVLSPINAASSKHWLKQLIQGQLSADYVTQDFQLWLLKQVRLSPETSINQGQFEQFIVEELTKAGQALDLEGISKFMRTIEGDNFNNIINRLENNSQKIETPLKVINNQNPTAEPPSDNIAISNAGLALLVPFLSQFFKNIGLVENAKITHFSKAISLLRYLVFKTEQFEEFEVVFEKILCGIPLSQGIPDRIYLSESEKEQCEELLSAVVRHWAVLKNTSNDGLRHNFLQRDGKLLFKNREWILTVQWQQHDILLEYLPWNRNMLKLPWMENLMIVKWNN